MSAGAARSADGVVEAADASEVVALLRELSWMLGVAESLTGGLLAAAVVDVPGASGASAPRIRCAVDPCGPPSAATWRCSACIAGPPMANERT